MKRLTDKELIDSLRERYEPSVIPPCRICGDELTVQAVGGGKPTKYACSGQKGFTDDGKYVFKPGRSFVDKHYMDSGYEDRRQGGDSDVMELIKRFISRDGSVY